MSIDLATLGKKLKQARLNAGITQEAAADAIGAPRTAVVQIEAGNRNVSTLELATLADLFRRPVADFFTEASSEEDDILVALYRLSPSLDDNPAVKEEVSRCVAMCREGVALEALLGRKPRSGPPAYDLSDPRSTYEAVEQGASIAQEERNRLGLGDAPIADMAELITNQGIWTSGAMLTDEISGLFLRHASMGMVILVNCSHVRGRKRFSYAHEYAHAILDRDRTVNATTQSNSGDLVEKRANAFAAAFLAPKGGVAWIIESMGKGRASRQEDVVYSVATNSGAEAEARSVPGSQEITYQDVAMMAHHFGVSYQAATYRLRSLDILRKAECEQLLQQEELGREYLRILSLEQDLEGHDDDATKGRELVTQVAHAAVEAYRREVISRGRLLDVSKRLGIQGRRLVALAEAAKGQ